MKNKIYLIPAFLIALTVLATVGLAVSYWARVTTYYNVPADHSFNVAFPSSYSGGYNVSANNATLANWISFNFSTVPEDWVQPFTNGSSTDNQAGPSKPIFLIYNTGNANSAINLNTTSITNIDICSNSSCVATECSGEVTACTVIEGAGLVSMGTVNTGKRMNVTLYANVSVGVSPGEQSGTTYIQST